ncbi:glutamic acid-rich protein-like isoform X1 [Simochromis diagramma]|uniref:glutamic acid-rich protein-like isoform X1 n=1 Tax=Simochromis diagramma TaxID=43689 RepID=UPI001A7EF151|nr:glutamic acid-rich protein-like isoform X1 [Simochromis diagramma]
MEEGRTSPKKRKRVTDDKDDKNLWRVKCGDKKGWMDVEKLRKGKDCIEFEGSFYSPPEFEKLAGKDSCRKWKSSIYHKKAPLHFWFKRGDLTTTGYRQKKRKRQSSDLESQDLLTELLHFGSHLQLHTSATPDTTEDEDGEEDDEDMDEDDVWADKWEDKEATQISISSSEEESEEDHVKDIDDDGEEEDEDIDAVDVGNDEPSTEEDEDEEDDNDEDETVPAVASNHTGSSGIKASVTPMMKEVKGIVNIPPEKSTHHPDMPRSQVIGNNRDVAQNTAIKQLNVKKEPEEKLKKTTTSTISIPGKLALKNKEAYGIVNSLPEKTRHHPDTTRSEVSGNNRDVATNTAIKQLNVKKEPQEDLKHKEDRVKDEDEEQEDEHMDEDVVGDDEPSTEEDEDEESDNDEEETVPAVASNHTGSNGIIDTVRSAIPTPGKHALQMKEKSTHHPDMPRSEVSGNNRDVAQNTAIKQLNVKKEPEEKLKKTTTSTISTPGKPALDIKEVKGVVNSLPEKARDHPDTTRSEVNGNSRDVAKNTAIKQQNVKKEPNKELNDHQHTQVHFSGHSVTEVQSMRPEMSADMSEAPSSGPSASSGLDLDQLKREKVKMELKVLKLKEYYYTLKIKELKK